MAAPHTTTLKQVADAIDNIAADLGGDPRIRMAIACEFDTILRQEIYLKQQPDDDRKVILDETPSYILADDSTMRLAIRSLQRRTTRRIPDLAPPNYRGATLRIELDRVELASPTSAIMVAVAGMPNRRTGWVEIFLTAFGRRVAGLPDDAPDSQTSRSSKGMGGARTALLDLIRANFGVDLREGA